MSIRPAIFLLALVLAVVALAIAVVTIPTIGAA
jgi:hypothetical protein